MLSSSGHNIIRVGHHHASAVGNPLSFTTPLPIINPRARMRSEGSLESVGFSVGRSVGLCLCSHVFSRTVAAVDTKRGYVGMCNGRSAQQESGAA